MKPADTGQALGGLTGIDHSLLGVRDLEAARRRFESLGFTLTPRGRHIGWGTANYCIMFEAGYVELLGIVDPAQFTNDLDGFLV
ncbi:MAG: VOC family protein, partial [Dongiales bacterium]